MSTADPGHHEARLPVTLESVMWDVHAHRQAVQVRLADVDALAEATTDPWVDRRVVIDQAVDLRRALLDQAEQTRRTFGSPGSIQRRLRRDHGHRQVFLAALEAVPRAGTVGAVLAAVLYASAGAARPLAGALVDQADLGDVAERSVAACRRFLVLADHVISTADTISRRR